SCSSLNRAIAAAVLVAPASTVWRSAAVSLRSLRNASRVSSVVFVVSRCRPRVFASASVSAVMARYTSARAFSMRFASCSTDDDMPLMPLPVACWNSRPTSVATCFARSTIRRYARSRSLSFARNVMNTRSSSWSATGSRSPLRLDGGVGAAVLRERPALTEALRAESGQGGLAQEVEVEREVHVADDGLAEERGLARLRAALGPEEGRHPLEELAGLPTRERLERVREPEGGVLVGEAALREPVVRRDDEPVRPLFPHVARVDLEGVRDGEEQIGYV